MVVKGHKEGKNRSKRGREERIVGWRERVNIHDNDTLILSLMDDIYKNKPQ